MLKKQKTLHRYPVKKQQEKRNDIIVENILPKEVILDNK